MWNLMASALLKDILTLSIRVGLYHKGILQEKSAFDAHSSFSVEFLYIPQRMRGLKSVMQVDPTPYELPKLRVLVL